MKCLAFVTQKGGAGKSTLAASLAVAAVEAAERPFLIDLDPQGALLNWSQRRRADAPAVDRIGADQLAPALQGLAGNGYTLAIIDTQGIDSPAVAAAMRGSHLALIPSRPSALDIEASRPTLAALNRLQRPYAFILNQCPPSRSTRLADGASALNLLGVLQTHSWCSARITRMRLLSALASRNSKDRAKPRTKCASCGVG